MGFFDTLNVSATGLTAQRLRMDVISQNIANVDTTKAADGQPYKRKVPLFQEMKDTPFSRYFEDALGRAIPGKGVRVSRITEDETPGALVYEPGHPDADENGYLRKPNVNIVTEMVNMISATRSYDANITAMNATKSMVAKTLEIGRT